MTCRVSLSDGRHIIHIDGGESQTMFPIRTSNQTTKYLAFNAKPLTISSMAFDNIYHL